jgi:hypothetical protein
VRGRGGREERGGSREGEGSEIVSSWRLAEQNSEGERRLPWHIMITQYSFLEMINQVAVKYVGVGNVIR